MNLLPLLGLMLGTLVFAKDLTRSQSRYVGREGPDRSRHLPLGLPSFKNHRNIIWIYRDAYVIAYDTLLRGPRLAAWKLDADDLGMMGRSGSFRWDFELEEVLNRHEAPAVHPEEYANSCYDRGHFVPSADRSADAFENQETFYMSNIGPQTKQLNRVLWRAMEQDARVRAKEGEELWIVAGILDATNPDYIGPDANIRVPKSYYKIISSYPMNMLKKAQVLSAVIFPNYDESLKLCQAGKMGLSLNLQENWLNYEAPLHQIAEQSGVNFGELFRAN